MVVLVDTSIWIDYFRAKEDRLSAWLSSDQIIQHSYVTAEVGMGSFESVAARAKTIDFLESFAQAQIADEFELSDFVEKHQLFGTGLGFPDASLLHAAIRVPGAKLWTRDKRLRGEAVRLKVDVLT